MNQQDLHKIQECLQTTPSIKFAFLFGSQARGDNSEKSDWDIAVWLSDDIAPLERLAIIEDVRSSLGRMLSQDSASIDIVELNRSELSIATSVVDEGIVLKGDDSLALVNYYVRIWALEEDFLWRLHNEPRTLPTTNA